MSKYLNVSGYKAPHHHRNSIDKSFSSSVSYLKQKQITVNANENATTVHNFDPDSRAKTFLNSPRSLEALNRLCFEEEELLRKHKEDFMNDPLPLDFQNDREYYIEIKMEHHERRRQEKVKMCIDEREKIIDEPTRANLSQSFSVPSMNHSRISASVIEPFSPLNQSAFLEKEKKRLEMLQKIQKNEFQHKISDVLRQRDFKKKVEDKVERAKSIEERREIELKKKLYVYEREKEKRIILKMERERKTDTVSQDVQRKQKEEAQKQRERQQKLWDERQSNLQEREMMRKQKAEALNQKIQSLQQRRQAELESRKKVLEGKTEKHRLQIQAHHSKKQQEGEKSRNILESRIVAAKKQNERTVEEQRIRVEERQKELIKKRERLEAEKETEIEQKKVRAAQKLTEIKRLMEEKQKQEEKKKEIYRGKLESIEKNRTRVQMEIEKRLKMRAQEAQEKENRIKEQIQNQERLRDSMRFEREEQLFENLKLADDRKEQNIQEVRKKHLVEVIRLQEAAENVARLEKMKERKREMYVKKMNTDYSRVETIQKDRDFRIQHRRQLHNILQSEKSYMRAEFEKKQHKLFFGSFNDSDIQSILTTPSPVKQRPNPVRQLLNTSHASTDYSVIKSKYKRPSLSTASLLSPTNGLLKSPMLKTPQNPRRQQYKSIDIRGSTSPQARQKTSPQPKPVPPTKPVPQTKPPPQKIVPKKPEIPKKEAGLEELMNKRYDYNLLQARTKNLAQFLEKLESETDSQPEHITHEDYKKSASLFLITLQPQESEYNDIRHAENGYFLFDYKKA